MLSAWEFFAFVANSIVFLLIGMQVAGIGDHAARLGHLRRRDPARPPRPGGGGLPARDPVPFIELVSPFSFQNVLFWGGLRGALGLALALAVPPSVPERVAIILSAFVVVAFSIFVQGLTMPWLVERLGLVRKQPRR